MTELGKNIAASVLARLLAGAQKRREDFNLTLQRYAAERFLYRLGVSAHREHFVLKGAMLFALWGGSLYRATRDLDLTGYVDDNASRLVAIIQEICAIPCPNDGLTFQAATVRAEPIRDQSEYHGFRVKLQVLLGTARLALQIDVGLGDTIEPPAQEEEFPVLLAGPAPRIRAYPRDAVVAEKFHAMVVLGAANTRSKDFYDIFALSRHFSFSGPTLVSAIAATFERRRTPFPDALPTALAPGFYSDEKRAAEWQRFVSRSSLSAAPGNFEVVGDGIQAFLGPVWSALARGETLTARWRSGGTWEGGS